MWKEFNIIMAIVIIFCMTTGINMELYYNKYISMFFSMIIETLLVYKTIILIKKQEL